MQFENDFSSAAAAAKSLQSCPTLCDRIDGSPPGSPIPGILQARTLEWGAIAFSVSSPNRTLINTKEKFVPYIYVYAFCQFLSLSLVYHHDYPQAYYIVKI